MYINIDINTSTGIFKIKISNCNLYVALFRQREMVTVFICSIVFCQTNSTEAM
jgi:hypothetical protein